MSKGMFNTHRIEKLEKKVKELEYFTQELSARIKLLEKKEE